MESLIEVQNLSFWYDREQQDTPAIKEVCLQIGRGEFLAVVGPNGCGKSTLVKHLNGLLTPCRGKVTVDGLDTGDAQNLPFIRRKVGMVFQNPDAQLFASVVEEDVAFGVENLGLPRSEIKDRVELALAQVGMTEYRNHPPRCLSGGQRQKVAIAGVLAMQPECIVLDEPTSMLDPQGQKEVLDAVRALNAGRQITVVYVTHNLVEVLYCHRLAALAEGAVIFAGRPEDFFACPEQLQRAGLEAPPVKQLVNILIKEGLNLPGTLNSPEELVDYLCRSS